MVRTTERVLNAASRVSMFISGEVVGTETALGGIQIVRDGLTRGDGGQVAVGALVGGIGVILDLAGGAFAVASVMGTRDSRRSTPLTE